MEALHRADNDHFLLDEGPPTWTHFDIYMSKARAVPAISGDDDLVPVVDTLDQIQSRVHSPAENIQIYPLSQNLRQGYKLHVTSHCKDIEQNWRHGPEEGGDERRHRDVTVSLLWIFFKTQRAPLWREIKRAFLCMSGNEGVQPSQQPPPRHTNTHTHTHTAKHLLKAALLRLPIHIV